MSRPATPPLPGHISPRYNASSSNLQAQAQAEQELGLMSGKMKQELAGQVNAQQGGAGGASAGGAPVSAGEFSSWAMEGAFHKCFLEAAEVCKGSAHRRIMEQRSEVRRASGTQLLNLSGASRRNGSVRSFVALDAVCVGSSLKIRSLGGISVAAASVAL